MNIAAAHSYEAEVVIKHGYPVTVNDASFVDFARGVATELVGDVAVGDRLLVHAGVAIGRVGA